MSETGRRCDACGAAELRAFADLGEIPILCGVHFADAETAAGSPVGRMILAACDQCAYIRNLAFDPGVMVYDTTMDTNLHHSPAFQAFSAALVKHLAQRYDLAGARVLDIGCGQGEFLRELCHIGSCRGIGYDAMYAGPIGDDPSGAIFHSREAPRGAELPEFDLVTSRHWFEHLADPHEFLADLRVQAGDRPVAGYIEVPDARYDLASAGWEVIYPHVSYFDAFSLRRVVERAGWRVEDTGTFFSGMFRYIEFSANNDHRPRYGIDPLPRVAERDRQLASIASFAARQRVDVASWRGRITELSASGAKPVLWGAGSRGVQFLTFADPEQRLAAVADVNPRKWGRFLPVTAHQVQSPDALTALAPAAVIITNPAYRDEIGQRLRDLGIEAELLIA